VPIRPPGFCTGCPERPIFAALKMVEQELGKHQIAGDIGCHLFASAAALRNRRFDHGLRSRPGLERGFRRRRRETPISILAMAASGTTVCPPRSATPSTTSPTASLSLSTISIPPPPAARTSCPRAPTTTKATGHPIAEAVKGVGVKWVREVDRTYDVPKMRDT
jgi:indolepyruvate ferredoxin oxidoreductase alpha subunit